MPRVFVSHSWSDAKHMEVWIANLSDKEIRNIEVTVDMLFESTAAAVKHFCAPPAPWGDFETFAREFKEKLIRVIQRQLGVRRKIAEEIANVALDAVWRQISKGRAVEWPFAYLKTVAIRLTLSHLRVERRMLPSPASYDVRDEHAEDALRQAELRTDIARAVKSLPPRMREILLLRLDGRSYAEIAGRLDISQGTVATQLARARDQLRLLLAGWEAE